MTTTALRAASSLLPAFTIAATLTFAAVPASAQPGDDERGLDPVLQVRASQLTGRSRVIVKYRNDAADVRAITSRRGRIVGQLSGDRSHVADVENHTLAGLAADPRVERVMIDRPVFPTLARTGAAIGATGARQQLDVTGRGVGVVIIDSGIASWHDDLYLQEAVTRSPKRLVHYRDFTTGPDSTRRAAPSDDFGHGTHVASSIAGSGVSSGGARQGIAPDASLLVLKVLDDQGNGYISDVIAAFDHAIAIKDAFNVRVINLAVASGVFESFRHDPLAQAARRAVEAGIVVVAAAGNLGLNAAGEVQYGGITSPGNAPWVLTVGASSHAGTARRSDDTIAGFSSRGPTWIDFAAKPDLVAPGVGIEAAAAANSTLFSTHAEYLLDGGTYLSLSGTSMAAPVVAGTVALMLEANPRLTPNEVKAILQFTAQELPGESALAQGAGLLNAAGAIRMARHFGAPDRPIEAFDTIEGEHIPWAQHLIWGNYRLTGGVPVPGSNAWAPGLPWGALTTARGAPVEWGVQTVDATRARQNIVWATTGPRQNIVWATGARQNIVWATRARNNIVWATGVRQNIVWATGARQNIVWATGARQNIVWATGARQNIVWATGARQNIVWATAVAENVVWGSDCDGENCRGVAWGPGGDGTVHGTAHPADNTVWATGARNNIVWATRARNNIVWATRGRQNIVWATGSDGDEIVWTAAAPDRVIWPVRGQ